MEYWKDGMMENKIHRMHLKDGILEYWNIGMLVKEKNTNKTAIW